MTCEKIKSDDLNPFLFGLNHFVLSAVNLLGFPPLNRDLSFPQKSKKMRTLLRNLVCFSLLIFISSSSGLAQEWGNLKGKFIATGDAPKAVELVPDKDKAACELPMYSRQLLIDKDGGLANVVVFLKKPSKAVPVHPSYKEAMSKPVQLDNLKCRFEPHILIMTTSQKLRVKNSDAVGHNANITSFNDDNSHNPNIPAGKFVDLEMPEVETRPINAACNSHAWMKSYILVRDEPYMAVSAKNGEFEIMNLPAGEHTFQFWQENVGYVKKASAGGKTLPKGRRAEIKLTIKAGETLDLGKIEIPVESIVPKD